MFSRPATAVVTLALMLALSGCWGGGADVRNTNNARSTTVGQELIDLQRAYEQGLIDQKEYERQRKRVLRRRD